MKLQQDFRALGQVVKGSGEQVAFFSVLPVAGYYEGIHRKTQQINTWLQDWCHHQQNFGFSDHGSIYVAPGLLATKGAHLSHRGRSILAHESAGIIERALN